MKFVGDSTPAYTFPTSPKRGTEPLKTGSPPIVSYDLDNYYKNEKKSVSFLTAKKPEIFPPNENPGVGRYNLKGDILDNLKDNVSKNPRPVQEKNRFYSIYNSEFLPGPGQYETSIKDKNVKILPGIGIKEHHEWVIRDSGLGPEYNPNYNQVWMNKKGPMMKKPFDLDKHRKKKIQNFKEEEKESDDEYEQEKKENIAGIDKKVNFALNGEISEIVSKTQGDRFKKSRQGQFKKNPKTFSLFKANKKFSNQSKEGSYSIKSSNSVSPEKNINKENSKKKKNELKGGVSFSRARRNDNSIDKSPGPGAYVQIHNTIEGKITPRMNIRRGNQRIPHKLDEDLYYIDRDIPGPGTYDLDRKEEKKDKDKGFTMGYGPKFDKKSCFVYQDNGIPGPGQYRVRSVSTRDKSGIEYSKTSPFSRNDLTMKTQSMQQNRKNKKGTFARETRNYLKKLLKKAQNIPGPKYQIGKPIPPSPNKRKKKGKFEKKMGNLLEESKTVGSKRRSRMLLRESRKKKFLHVLPRKKRTWIDKISMRSNSLPGPGQHNKNRSISNPKSGVSFTKGKRFLHYKKANESKNSSMLISERGKNIEDRPSKSTRADVEDEIKSLFRTATEYYKKKNKGRRREKKYPTLAFGGFKGMVWKSTDDRRNEIGQVPGPGAYDIRGTIPQLQSWVKKKIEKKGWKIKPV